jgi:hypothetical protein
MRYNLDSPPDSALGQAIPLPENGHRRALLGNARRAAWKNPRVSRTG